MLMIDDRCAILGPKSAADCRGFTTSAAHFRSRAKAATGLLEAGRRPSPQGVWPRRLSLCVVTFPVSVNAFRRSETVHLGSSSPVFAGRKCAGTARLPEAAATGLTRFRYGCGVVAALNRRVLDRTMNPGNASMSEVKKRREMICRSAPEQTEFALFRPAPTGDVAEKMPRKAEASPAQDGEDLRRNPPVLMNEREVAVVLNVCPRSVRNFTSRRLLPVIRLGRRRLFRRDAVLAALAALESGGPGEMRRSPSPRRL